MLAFWMENGQAFWGKVYLAKSEITSLEQAIVSYQKEYGTYPTNLGELVNPLVNSGHHRQFLTTIPSNPWGGPYHYEVERGATGPTVKISTVPDNDTQKRIGVTELSNETNWPTILGKRHTGFWH